MKFKSNEALGIFLFAFGVFCFGLVTSSASYVLFAVDQFGFALSGLVYMLIKFLFINVAVSAFISILLTKVLGKKIVLNFLFVLTVYFATAQLFFYLPWLDYYFLKYFRLPEFYVGIFVVLIFSLLSFIYFQSTVFFFSKLISHLSSALFIILLILYGIKLVNKKDDTQDKYVISQFNYLSNNYKNFKSSSKKKLSVFIILGDEIPLSLISDGNTIKDSYPNIKSLSEKSLFFTKAFSNYDGTWSSTSSMFTGTYRFNKDTSWKKRKNKDWLYEKRNIFTDLKFCGYDLLISHNDPNEIRRKVVLGINSSMYDETVLINGTINFLAHVNSLQSTYFFDYIYYASRDIPNIQLGYISNSASNTMITESLIKSAGKRVFYFKHDITTHKPYIPHGESPELPNSYLTPDNKDIVPVEQLPAVLEKQIKCLEYFDKKLGEDFDNIIKYYGEDNVLIIFLSDHGIGWRPPLLARCRGYITWDIVGVPLMIYCPSLLKPEVYDKPFPLIDLLPTIYDLIELEYKEDEFVGISFFNKERERPRDLFAYGVPDWRNSTYMLRNGKWEKTSPPVK